MKRFIVLLLVCCLGAAVTARPIRGTVKCAGTPVSGVTDSSSVVPVEYFEP